jgi:single-strand DNA-binding protein
MSFSQIQLLGNLGRDPEMNYTPDGTAVCKFSIAVSKKVKGSEETTWYNCTAWRNLAEMLSTHLKKGQMVFVQGDLQVRQYTTRDGKNGTSLDVTIDKFQFAGGRRDESVATSTGSSNDNPLGELEDHPF